METILMGLLMCGVAAPALAAPGFAAGYEEYRGKALAEAARVAAERRETRIRTEGVAVALRHKLGLERFYKVGDSWLVAVSHRSSGMVNGTGDESTSRDVFLAPVYYRFRVTALRDDSRAEIDVWQVDADGKVATDLRVHHLAFSLGHNYQTVSKSYFYKDRLEPIAAEYTSDNSVPIGFDSFPVELPDFGQARELELGATTASQGLPPALARLAPRGLTAANAVRFDSPDLLARRIRTTWRRGDLWPAVVVGPAHAAVLVRQEKQQ